LFIKAVQTRNSWLSTLKLGRLWIRSLTMTSFHEASEITVHFGWNMEFYDILEWNVIINKVRHCFTCFSRPSRLLCSAFKLSLFSFQEWYTNFLGTGVWCLVVRHTYSKSGTFNTAILYISTKTNGPFCEI
jgi:hypothetical protein